MIKVAIVEDNKIIKESLSTLINGTDGFSCSIAFPDCESLLKQIDSLDADILLMDIKLPGMSGIDGIKLIKQILPDLTILMLTIYEENDLVFEALCAGATGYLVKKTPPAKLLESIKEAYEGGAPMSAHIARKVVDYFQKKNTGTETILTEREITILRELVTGKPYHAIAEVMSISIDTVRFHVKKIYKKLNVHSQAEAVSEAIRKKLL